MLCTYITSFNVSRTSGLLISSSIALGMWTSRPAIINVELSDGDHHAYQRHFDDQNRFVMKGSRLLRATSVLIDQ
jgi:hypothetical protein